MYYFNARWAFKLPAEVEAQVPGGIIAVSGLPHHTLRRRRFHQYPYLQHRLIDPQLYLSDLTAERSPGTIVKLASYPWFPSGGVPEYDSSQHGTQKDWKEAHAGDLLAAWDAHRGFAESEIASSARAAVDLQVALGVRAIVLPSPLTRVANTDYAIESAWLDSGIAAARQADTNLPVLATVAVSDIVLRPSAPGANAILSAVIDQVTAREIAGVYLVVEMASEENYTCGDLNTVQSILTIIDELVRGARMRVVVNYIGSLWPLAAASGAEIWASGYYLGQRKLRLSEFEAEEDDVRRAFPRYHSLPIMGDLGLQADLDRINAAGLLPLLRTNSAASRPLHRALEEGRSVSDVPGWEYSASNISAASAHYTDTAARAGALLGHLSLGQRVEWVRRALDVATDRVARLRAAGIKSSRKTELGHQATWRAAFENWLADR